AELFTQDLPNGHLHTLPIIFNSDNINQHPPSSISNTHENKTNGHGISVHTDVVTTLLSAVRGWKGRVLAISFARVNMAWRSKKIFSLLPPVESEESDIESDDDLEGNLERREYYRNSDSDSSSIRTISPALYDILADLSDNEDHEHMNVAEQPSQTAPDESSPFPGKPSAPSCYIPETPSPIVSASPSSSISRPTLLSNTATRRTRQTTIKDSSPMPPPATTTPVAKKRKMKHLDFIFKKRLYTGTVHTSDSPNFKERHDILSPKQYFQNFFTNELLDIIVEMTNLYSVQTTGKSICVTQKEIEVLLGIEILMGIVDLPAVEDYWSADLKYEQISSAMSLKRYRSIKRYLHFCDNTNLCRTISNPILSTVYFDNWFTSLELIYYLRNEMGILSLGTLRKDRLRNCKLMTDKAMMKKGRGTFEVVCDNSKKIACALALINTCTKSRFNVMTNSPKLATITKPVQPRPVDDARLDCYDHFPIFTSQGRCRLCKNGKTMIMCTKCQQRLCLTAKKSCYLRFHKEKARNFYFCDFRFSNG
ncbi:hypothetical protein HW555_009554, partial [Spodoptera exigua]